MAGPRVPRAAARLEGVTSTIFAEMSALAVSTAAINLGQGFPDESGPREVVDEVTAQMLAGRNQYPPGHGAPELLDAVIQARGEVCEASAPPVFLKVAPDLEPADIDAIIATLMAVSQLLADVPEVAELILQEIGKMGSTEPTEADLAPRRATLIGGFGRSLETVDGLGALVANLALYDLPMSNLADYAGRVRAVTPEQVEAAIDLTEAQLAGIEPGTPYLIWREGDGAQPARGTVDRIAPVADAQTRTRRVYINLADTSGFRIGSLIRARPAGGQLGQVGQAVLGEELAHPTLRLAHVGARPRPDAGGDDAAVLGLDPLGHGQRHLGPDLGQGIARRGGVAGQAPRAALQRGRRVGRTLDHGVGS